MKRKIHIRWVNEWPNKALEYLTTHIISLTNRLNSSHSPAYESGKNDVKEKNNFEKILIRLSIHFFLFEPTSLFGKSIFYIEIDNYVTEFVKSNKKSAKYDWYLMIIIQISFITELGYWFYTDTVHISKIVRIVTLTAITNCHWYTRRHFFAIYDYNLLISNQPVQRVNSVY